MAFDSTPLIIGHRGAAGLAPENTLLSFRVALTEGVGAVELDIHRCEGELVVIHDATLERTTNGHGTVSETPLAALRALDAGDGECIPLLEEVFDLIPSEIGINIELKGRGCAPMLAELLERRPRPSILVSSFDHQQLNDFRSANETTPCAPLYGRWKSDAIGTAIGFAGGFVNLSRKIATAERLEQIHQAGLRSLIYTVNDPIEADRLFRQGVWGVFTDYPDRMSGAAFQVI